MKIRILSDEMASRIAAGEVVERPASVVKELVENSLDAGATEVSVGVEKSGASLIRVTDNGSGMEPQDLALAVERHATSKLAEDADLFRIATLGFRGEALPSIGAVAKLEIVSRPPGAPSAYRVHVAGGKKAGPFPAAAAAGTTIEVREIFFNTPARKKFLKSPATELSHICDVVNRLALAYPRVHFRLQHDGRTLADYAAVGDGKDRLYQVFGPDIAKGLKPFHGRRGELSAYGYLTSAPVSFPNARHLYTFVNRRYVRDKVLTHAVLYGYETLLMKGQYPAAVLFVDLPFEQVDVNVHPAKLEVRFRRQSDVHEAVSSAVRDALKIEATKPAAGAQTTAMPLGVHEETLPYGDAAAVRTDLGWPATQVAAPPSAAVERRQGFFSSLRVLGQVLGCYLVCVSPKGLVLIDQHAAHERVAFEKLRRQLDSGKVERQNLLLPQSVELNGGEMMLLAGRIEVLERFGFALEPFGPNAYAIKSAPALLPEGDYTQLVRQMVAELAEVDTSARLRQRLEERLATIACHSVIRANRKLEMDEIHALLGDLDQIEFATQCPHGRPVVIEFSRDQLDRLFKRLV
ncbi:MAG TPA: DNA mismatch repair endonuclease MutL [Methylomirabilota bacterium]|nr:DNA mismatch repair endonuclease MutL [Methylomirabilota bacterium]